MSVVAVSSKKKHHQDHRAGPLVALEDLVGDPGHRTTDLGGIEEPASLVEPGHRDLRKPGAPAPGTKKRPAAPTERSLPDKLLVSLPGLTGPALKGKIPDQRIAR